MESKKELCVMAFIGEKKIRKIADKYNVRYKLVNGEHRFEVRFLPHNDFVWRSASESFSFKEIGNKKYNYWHTIVYDNRHITMGLGYSVREQEPISFEELLRIIDSRVSFLNDHKKDAKEWY